MPSTPWSVGITSYNLPTNESGGSRKRKFDGDRFLGRRQRKCGWMGQPYEIWDS